MHVVAQISQTCMHGVAQKSQTWMHGAAQKSQTWMHKGKLRCLRLCTVSCTFAHSCQVRWKPGRRLKSEVEYGWSRLFFFIQVHLMAQVVSFSSLPIKKGWLGILRMGGGHHLVDGDSVIVRRTNNSHILQILQFIHADLCDDESLFCLCLILAKAIESTNPQYYVFI